MLQDLRLLLAHTAPDAVREQYAQAVLDSNVLSKPTRKARELALHHLTTLYALDPSNPIFRALRRLWPLNEAAQPMLALAMALARDPLLRSTQDFVLGQEFGALMPPKTVETFLASRYPERFSPASIRSFSQNVAGTWSAAGFLSGRHTRRFRSRPISCAESLVMLLFLGFLQGRTGQRLFSSSWTDLLCVPLEELESLAIAASHRGLFVFMNAGGVKEVRFPGYLTAEEDLVCEELACVV